MKILVCIKQVIESASPVIIHPDKKKLAPSSTTRYEINPYDESAVEEAIRIKELFDATHIDVITVGPARAEDALRRALGMGADEGIHIIDDADHFRLPSLTALWISEFAKDKSYDLILTGIMSSDEMNAQTGPMIAQMLGYPCATAVIKQSILPDKKHMVIEREIEGGERDVFEISLPCVLTIQTGINLPRYPSLSKVLRAKKRTFTTIRADRQKAVLPNIEMDSLILPQKTARGTVLDGSSQDKAEKLLEILESKIIL